MGKSEESNGTQTVRTNSVTGPPAWARGAAEALWHESEDVAKKTKATQFARPADLTEGQQSLFAQLMGNVGAANPAFQNSASTLSTLQGFNAPWLKPQTLAGTDLQPYMNPYTKFVKDAALDQGKVALAQGLNQTADSAIGAGAFGGSRHGVREGAANAQFARDQAQLSAGLDAQNFAQAQAAAGTDIGNDLSAQAQNAGNAIQGAGVRMSAANSGATVAGQQQEAYLQSLFGALTGQNQVQGQQQALNQWNTDTANAQNMLPYQLLQIKQGTLSGLPMAQETQGTQQQASTAPGSQTGKTVGSVMGAVGTAASIAAMFM
jgi:hypothetical protein